VCDASGRPIGAALVVLSRVVVPAGIELVPMIDSVFLPRPSAEALLALIRFSSERWADQPTSSVVTAPNLSRIDEALLRATGLRATPSVFQGYLSAPMTGAPLGGLTRTNLEII
jgi:hypothetical protein